MVLLCPTTKREPAAVLTQHASRRPRRRCLRIHDYGFEIQALREAGSRLLRAPRVAHVDLFHAAEGLGVTEHLRQPRRALLARG